MLKVRLLKKELLFPGGLSIAARHAHPFVLRCSRLMPTVLPVIVSAYIVRGENQVNAGLYAADSQYVCYAT